MEKTPEEMKIIEDNRLSETQAHELANMIQAKLEEYDLKQLKPKDYEKAMKEIEVLQNWANGRYDGRVPDMESFMIILGSMILIPAIISTRILINVISATFNAVVTSPKEAFEEAMDMVVKMDNEQVEKKKRELGELKLKAAK